MGKKAHRRARGRAFSEDEEAVQDVEVQVDDAPRAPSAPPTVSPDESGPAAAAGVSRRTPAALLPVFAGLVDFAVAGTETAGEFRCSDCGYGAVVHRALPPCPMCGGTVWESRPPRLPD